MAQQAWYIVCRFNWVPEFQTQHFAVDMIIGKLDLWNFAATSNG